MATPDQKSPNVLLQNLCCRILGRSEGTRGGAQGMEAQRHDPGRPGSCYPWPREREGVRLAGFLWLWEPVPAGLGVRSRVRTASRPADLPLRASHSAVTSASGVMLAYSSVVRVADDAPE